MNKNKLLIYNYKKQRKKAFKIFFNTSRKHWEKAGE